VITRLACDFDSTEHARNFFDSRVRAEQLNRYTALRTTRLGYSQVSFTLHGNLWQMRDAQYLPILAQGTQFAAYDFSHAAADTHIDLIVDREGNRIDGRGHDLQCQ
tara:strand:+ start:372 stop:689 length:318 start_codon:yes stop_codon:yes gene_type:complete